MSEMFTVVVQVAKLSGEEPISRWKYIYTDR